MCRRAARDGRLCGGSAGPGVARTRARRSRSGPAFALGRAGERWAELVDGARAGQFHGQGVSGRDARAARRRARVRAYCSDGAADLAVGSALAWSAQCPRSASIAMPWLASDARPARRAARRPDGPHAPRRRACGAGRRDWSRWRRSAIACWRRRASRCARQRTLRACACALQPGARPRDLHGARRQARRDDVRGGAGGARGEHARRAGRDGDRARRSARVAATGSSTPRWGAFADAIVFVVRRAVWDGWTEAHARRGARTPRTRRRARPTALAREERRCAELGAARRDHPAPHARRARGVSRRGAKASATRVDGRRSAPRCSSAAANARRARAARDTRTRWPASDPARRHRHRA